MTRPFQRALAKVLGKTNLPTILTVLPILQLVGATGIVSYLFWQHRQALVREVAIHWADEASERIEFRLKTYLREPHLLNQSSKNAIAQGVFDSNDSARLKRFLQQQLLAFESIGSTGWCSARGGALYVSKDEAAGKTDPLDSAQFCNSYKTTQTANKPMWGPVHFERERQQLAIDAILPVYDARGTLLGVLNTPLYLSHLGTWLSDVQSDHSSRSFLVDRDGRTIASSDSSNSANSQLSLAIESDDRLVREASLQLIRHFSEIAGLQEARQLEVDIDGQHYFVRVSPFHEERGLDWSIVTLIPISDFANMTGSRAINAIALCLLGIGIATVSGILTARWIVRPIRRLNTSARNLARGKWNESVSVEGLNEVGQLARSFNLMAKKLQSSFTALERQNKDLHRLSDERQSVNDELQRVNAELQRLDRLKDEFLATISHELRTPLNGMVGLAESTIDSAAGELSALQRQNLHAIVSSGHRLSKLVNEILDFSKLKHHKVELQLKPVEVCSIVEVVLTICKTLVGDKPILLTNVVPEDIPLAYADENRLQQILYNLVGNAIKFTEAGTVRVGAAVEEDESERGYRMLAIEVSDTGIGIPAESRDRIFSPFEQADGSTARPYDGTGLGLTITQQLVELHGGRVWVESEVGCGSCFKFTLPLFESCVSSELSNFPLPMLAHDLNFYQAARSVEFDLEQPSSKRELLASEPPENGKFHILIVDDEPINLQVLNSHLSLANYTVTQALNGEQALKAIANGQSFDLIILDVMMPRMSGYEVCAKIREQYPAQQLPVVMLTAKDRVSDIVMGFGFGANDYISKPFSKDELLARVKSHLELSHISKAYGRFVPHAFIEFLQKESIVDIQLGDRVSKEMAVMFSDIRSFTALSEKMTPQENFDFVNAYLRKVSPKIREHRGFIVKYLGDGMMAVFPTGVDDAIAAAIDKLHEVNSYNEKRNQRGDNAIQVGIGIHVGFMMVGMVGEYERMQCDAFSDCVNLAARLESLTKLYGVSLLISEDTLNRSQDASQYQLRFLDRVIVQGRTKTTAIYEVLDGESGESRQLKLKTQLDFERAIDCYQKRQLTEAQTHFYRVLEVNPEDRVAALYLERIYQFLEHGVPLDWNGVWNLPQK
ncbi:ATP-binding protein [Oscillatoria sp. FACHB-1406]|uniref:ATP-binding protein n=1 Tax=Oscillatoria sp. FACHB-1406 TaxID=2692846 RepID=UPI001685BCF2|nr:ATP-binding protein [Oscillatoria sp. FACHB-1406]MBD2577982.1 response regulator [Oscillatoria sp. FACHB-1406]